MLTSPKRRVAFMGPHSPLAQSGRGTMTVCSSSQTILNLQTDLNFMGSPVRYSRGVTALAKMSSRKAPLVGAWTRNATTVPTTDCFQSTSKINLKTSYVSCTSYALILIRMRWRGRLIFRAHCYLIDQVWKGIITRYVSRTQRMMPCKVCCYGCLR